MDLTNESYVVLIGTRNFTERYYRDEDGWLKVSARGRRFRMTAEQVLNHLLPAVAGLKPGLAVKVLHRERPAGSRRTSARHPGTDGPRTKNAPSPRERGRGAVAARR